MGNLTVVRGGLPDSLPDLARFVLVGAEKLKAVKAEIAAIKKLRLAKEVYEQKQEEAQDISEAVQLASVQIGKLTNAIPKKSGGDHGNQHTGGKIPSGGNFGTTKKEEAEKLGLKKNQVSEFQRMADNEEIVKQALKEAREHGDIASRAFVLDKIKQAKREEKAAKQEERREENAAKVETLSTPLEAQGLFQTIVIDPPWDWGDEGDVNQLGRAKPEYTTMPIDEIERLPIARIADNNCHLYLWVTNRSLPKAFRLIDAWGFRYITCLTWVKPSIGMGNYFRGSTEQVLFAVKGSQPLKRHDVGTHFEAPRGGGHSAKPDEFYKLVESCSYAPYIDVFGRKAREGWAVWGENG